MDPTGLGLMVAGLIAKKALEELGGKAGETGWGVLGSIGRRVRGWFNDNDNSDGSKALDVVEAAPDSQRAVETLADLIAKAVEADPGLGAELEALADQAKDAGDGQVVSFVNEVRDNAKVGRIIQIGTGNYYESGSD